MKHALFEHILNDIYYNDLSVVVSICEKVGHFLHLPWLRHLLIKENKITLSWMNRG